MEQDDNSSPEASNSYAGVKTPEPKMSAFTQAFFQDISPSTLEEVCQVAETVANEDFDEFPLSPIVGYTFSDDSGESSESDPEAQRLLDQLNYIAFKKIPGPDSPTTKNRKRQGRKRRRIMLKRENGNSTKVPSIGSEIEKVNQCAGFTTAGGKNISVSSESLKKAQTLWLGTEVEEKIDTTETEKVNRCAGFTTAGEKNISVSSESLKKAQTIWLDTEVEEKIDTRETEKVNRCAGFTTAGGKNISVSSESLKKAQTLWLDTEVEEKIDTRETEKVNRCAGFTTAGGKNISVSSESLKKAQTLWLDTEIDENISIGETEEVNRCAGFTTAGGKNIRVSSEAAERAQSIWKDVSGAKEDRLKDLSKHQNIEIQSFEKLNKSYMRAPSNFQSEELSKEVMDSVSALLADEEDDKSRTWTGTSSNSSFENDKPTTHQQIAFPSVSNESMPTSTCTSNTPTGAPCDDNAFKIIKKRSYGDPPAILPLPIVKKRRLSKNFVVPWKK